MKEFGKCVFAATVLSIAAYGWANDLDGWGWWFVALLLI